MNQSNQKKTNQIKPNLTCSKNQIKSYPMKLILL